MHHSRTITIVIGAGLLGLLLSGCPSVATFNTARPIGKGKNQMAVAGHATGFAIAALGSSDDDDDLGLIIVPAVDLMYRRGFTDWFDMGVAIRGYAQIGVDAKFCLINTPNFALSLDPTLGGVFIGGGDVGAGYVQFDLPLLVDFTLADYMTLTLGVKYMGLLGFGADDTGAEMAYMNFPGANVGLEFKIGKYFRLMPYGGAVFWVDSGDAAFAWFTGGLASKVVF